MLKIPGIKILRVYGDVEEQAEFSIPNKRKPLRISTEDEAQEIDEELKSVSLHHVIRRDGCPFAGQIREFERGFNDDRVNGVKTNNSKVEDYRTVSTYLLFLCFRAHFKRDHYGKYKGYCCIFVT